MNYTDTATTTGALHILDIAAFTQHLDIEAAAPSAEGASIAEAMATAGTLDLTDVEWAATIGDFCRDWAEIERLEEAFA